MRLRLASGLAVAAAACALVLDGPGSGRGLRRDTYTSACDARPSSFACWDVSGARVSDRSTKSVTAVQSPFTQSPSIAHDARPHRQVGRSIDAAKEGARRQEQRTMARLTAWAAALALLVCAAFNLQVRAVESVVAGGVVVVRRSCCWQTDQLCDTLHARKHTHRPPTPRTAAQPIPPTTIPKSPTAASACARGSCVLGARSA